VKCPFCSVDGNRVVDSRDSGDDTVRRRRECEGCGRRFTTYERIDAIMPHVVKKGGRRETWDRGKIVRGLFKACEKRPVPVEAVESTTDAIEREVQELGLAELDSSVVGEAVMRSLKGLDEVAYVRFASVYRSFRDIDEFMSALESLVREKGQGDKQK
jgi:transcriptional repressor NrdR